ncbi:CBO0543 family protein [Bacillus sp. ISL-18]|uniref:CBO0543 family protein n=1 Tax=Bacillus sp. ISL-18 TaxID=2819118 RepID=UPI0035A936EA
MFHITESLLWIAVVVVMGYWKNLRLYHSTILYVLCCDLLYNFLTYNFPLWEYTDNNIFFHNHTIHNLYVLFLLYPSIVLVYLSTFPKKMIGKIIHVISFAVYWFIIEYITLKLGVIRHENGWTLLYAFPYDIIAFFFIGLHSKKPLQTYLLSIIATVFFLWFFHVPVINGK